MKKHITLIAGFILMFASSSLSAQDKANDYVKQLAQSINKHNSIEVGFTYQFVSGTDEDGADDIYAGEVLEGRAYFQGASFRVLMDGTLNISDGKTQWAYFPDVNEVMVGDASDEDNPVKILAGLEKECSAGTLGNDEQGNLVVELYDGEGFPMGLVLKFSKKGDFKGLVKRTGQESLILNVTDIKYDQNYKQGFFTFDKKAYPNVEVIDMR